jgi:uridylate kinase
MKKEIHVLSLGGSVFIPDRIDVSFLRDFRKLILKHIKGGKRFIIITGGGRTCRDYLSQAEVEHAGTTLRQQKR